MTPRSLALLALVLAAGPFGLLLAGVVAETPLVDLDMWIADDLHGAVRDTPWTVDVLRAITTLGKPALLIALSVVVAVALVARRRLHLAAYFVTTTVAGAQLNTLVKHVVGRERPTFSDPVATAAGMSFPSGHAMSSIVAYGALVLVVVPFVTPRWRRPVVAATATLVAAIGFSRIALGVHYLSDVLAGFALGAAWLALMTAALAIWRDDRSLANLSRWRSPTSERSDGSERSASRSPRRPRG